MVIDRPRHAKLIQEVRSTGAMVRMISDGDITAAIAPSFPDSGMRSVCGHWWFTGGCLRGGGNQMSGRRFASDDVAT